MMDTTVRYAQRWGRVTAMLAVASLLTLPTTARADDDTKTITIEGRAAGTDFNAKEQAKQDGLRRAVEQACGTFISGQTKVKNYEAIYDKAMSLAVGYVTEFEILDTREGDGITVVRLRATVSKQAFEKEWARLLHTIEQEGNPRCVVVIMEDNDTDDLKEAVTNAVVQSIVERFFLDKGVQLMDKGASEKMRQRDVDLAALNNDVNKLAAMAAAVKADVLVQGRAEARRAGTSEIGGKTLYKWTATINVRAYHADSAQMLMSNTYSATKSTVNSNQGGDEVLRLCAEENAGKMLSDVGQAWRKRQNIKRVCQVTLANCSRNDYKAFAAAAEKIDGVQSVRMKELVNEVCQVEIDWSYNLEALVTRIEELKIEGLTLEVTEQTHDRVMFKVSKS